MVRRLDDAGIVASELALRMPSLDEVFLTLTGHRAEDGQRAEDGRQAEDGLQAGDRITEGSAA